MRHLPPLLASLLFCWNTACFARYPVAKITLQVVNQDNVPVTDTEITASFWEGRQDIRKWPDANGYVTFSSQVIGDAVFGNATYKTIRNPEITDKYYKTIFRRFYTSPSKNSKDGKWQPWNPTIKCVLFERKNPIPMYANDRETSIDIPKRNEWCGFGMAKGAWVRPYGAGEHADIEVFHAWDGKKREACTGSILKMRFPDREAGYYAFIYEHREAMYETLRFKSPYHAVPNETYRKEITFSEKYDPKAKAWEEHFIPDDTGYIFRTRTRFDAQGRLIGAHYGKIYQPRPPMLRVWDGKGELRLPFYLNPTENDTNLECERNLLKRRHFDDYVEP